MAPGSWIVVTSEVPSKYPVGRDVPLAIRHRQEPAGGIVSMS